jgi:hypothetical protein
VAQAVQAGQQRDKNMLPNLFPETIPEKPRVYQIRVQGHLDQQWADWFGGLRVVLEENGDTVLTGPVVDQAALHGLLKKVRDLGMPLVSVNRTEGGKLITRNQE